MKERGKTEIYNESYHTWFVDSCSAVLSSLACAVLDTAARMDQVMDPIHVPHS